MPRLGWLIAMACLAWPVQGSGQEAPVAPPPPVVEEPSPKEASRPDTEVTLDKGTQVVFGIGYGGPIGAAASVRALHGLGASLRASLVRTWGSPVGTEPGLTYIGPELDLSIVRFNLTLGALWRVSGQAGASAVFSWGVGFGL